MRAVLICDSHGQKFRRLASVAASRPEDISGGPFRTEVDIQVSKPIRDHGPWVYRDR